MQFLHCRRHQLLDILSQVAVVLCLTMAVTHVGVAAGLLPSTLIWSGHVLGDASKISFLVWNILIAGILILSGIALRLKAMSPDFWIHVAAWMVTCILTAQAVLDILFSSAISFVAPVWIVLTLCAWIIASLDGIDHMVDQSCRPPTTTETPRDLEEASLPNESSGRPWWKHIFPSSQRTKASVESPSSEVDEDVCQEDIETPEEAATAAASQCGSEQV